jgi:small nuclear ribonucleoprotein D3
MAAKGIGIPIKLLHEAEGHVVTAELKTGEVYRGQLLEAEDNWNCQMSDVTYTGKDGKVTKLEHIFLRGSKIRFLVIPDMLKNAPMFKRIDPKFKKGLGAGRGGKAVAMRAKARGAN